MRATWDALAGAETGVYVGDPARGPSELAGLFGRLDADPRGGVCVEVGCGPGRMTAELAERFDRVQALDISPAMIDRARRAVEAANVEFRVISGRRLDGVGDGAADVLVCYLVLQHLPRRSLVQEFLLEFARVLGPSGEAFVQLPVLRPGTVPRAWRVLRTVSVPVLYRLRRDPASSPSLRGVRLTESELARSLRRSGLRALRRGVGPDAPYRFSRDVFLRLAHG